MSLFQVSRMILCVGLTAVALGADLPPPNPSPDAPYVRPDGSISIVGGSGLRSLLEEFNRRFTQLHPGFKSTMLLDATGATGLGGLAVRVSAFAPMDREAWPQETRPFRQLQGYEPADIRIARNGYPATGGLRPPAIYVNIRNPLAGLTLQQVARIFTRGGTGGDLTHWEQLGLTGEWQPRAIHLYGPRDNGGFISALRHSRMGGFPFSRRYEPLASVADIIKAVADDPYGIGLVGPHEIATLPPTVRLLPLGEQAPFRAADGADLKAGLYPLAEFLHLYINLRPGQAPEPLVGDYVRLVLSADGQQVISAAGHVPLPAREIEDQLAKLNQPAPSR